MTSALEEPLIVRTFPVPRPVLFRAWTVAEQVAAWWGPDGFRAAPDSVTIEPRVGGRYDLCMLEASDGAAFWVRNEVVDVVEPELLVLESNPMPEVGRPDGVVTTIRFEGVSGTTGLRFYRAYPPDSRDSARAGWNSSFDKLEALLLSFA